MTAVQNGQMPNTQWWSSFEIITSIHFLTEIVSSQRNIYINMHKYSTQLKSISVAVISYI